jgi:hypothetical protein
MLLRRHHLSAITASALLRVSSSYSLISSRNFGSNLSSCSSSELPVCPADSISSGLSPERRRRRRRRGEERTPRGSVFFCSMANTQKLEMKDGEFKRTESQFRSFVSREPGADFPPEAGRYHLYVSYACPWASRCYAFLLMKGLEDAIGLTVRDLFVIDIHLRVQLPFNFVIALSSRGYAYFCNNSQSKFPQSWKYHLSE